MPSYSTCNNNKFLIQFSSMILLILFIIPIMAIDQPQHQPQPQTQSKNQLISSRPSLQQSFKQLTSQINNLGSYIQQEGKFIDEMTSITQEKSKQLQDYNKKLVFMSKTLDTLSQILAVFNGFMMKIGQNYDKLIQQISGDYYYIVKLVFNVDMMMVMFMFIVLVNLVDDEEESKGYRKLCDGKNKGNTNQDIMDNVDINGQIDFSSANTNNSENKMVV